MSSPLLALPDELLLKVAEHLSSSVRYRNPQGDLLNFALTCSSLAPLAREVLFQAPILNSSNTAALISTLFKYSGLRGKTRRLMIKSRDTREQQAQTIRVPALAASLLRACMTHIRSLPLDQATKNAWINELSYRNDYEYSGSLVCVLFTLTPNLTKIYLGGSTLVNFPIFHAILPYIIPVKLPGFWLSVPDLSPVLRLFGAKLSVLELPSNFHISPIEQSWQIPEISDIPTYFPELKHWVVPANVVYDTACWKIVGPKVSRLTLTDAEEDVDDWVGGLWSRKGRMPSLTRVEVYYGTRVLPVTQQFRARLLRSGIKCKYQPSAALPYEIHTDFSFVDVEYIPDCCLRDDDAFYHPWIYSGAELDALEAARHERYAQEKEERERRERQERLRRLGRRVINYHQSVERRLRTAPT
jgi:hypothetical protein